MRSTTTASKSLTGEQTFFLACCHAGLAGLAGRPGSGVSAAEGADQAEKAMAVLRRAVAMGYRNPDTYRTESALDPLRNRPDFRALMMDLVFPPSRSRSETQGRRIPVPTLGCPGLDVEPEQSLEILHNRSQLGRLELVVRGRRVVVQALQSPHV